MKLGKVLKEYRYAKRLLLRPLAKEIGIGYATLMRLEIGHEPNYKTFKKILDWLSK